MPYDLFLLYRKYIIYNTVCNAVHLLLALEYLRGKLWKIGNILTLFITTQPKVRGSHFDWRGKKKYIIFSLRLLLLSVQFLDASSMLGWHMGLISDSSFPFFPSSCPSPVRCVNVLPLSVSCKLQVDSAPLFMSQVLLCWGLCAVLGWVFQKKKRIYERVDGLPDAPVGRNLGREVWRTPCRHLTAYVQCRQLSVPSLRLTVTFNILKTEIWGRLHCLVSGLHLLRPDLWENCQQ